jgi:hypothetical protein
MSGSSGFKIVAVVIVLSIAGVIVIDRFIDNGAFSSLSVFRRTDDASASHVSKPLSKPPDKTDGPSSRRTAKPSGITISAVEPTLREPTHATVENSPERQVITPGMSRTQVLKLFGEPTLRVTETYKGKVVERLIYASPSLHTSTVVFLENGRAVRSHTGAYLGVDSARNER